MVNIVDDYIANKTIFSKKLSNGSCIVNLVWRGELLLLSYNLNGADDLSVLSHDVLLDDEEVTQIKKIISKINT